MAVSSTIAYSTNRDLQDLLPGFEGYDLKRRIYNFVVDSGTRYVSHNCGVVTQLYADGKDLGSAQGAIGQVDVNDYWFYDSTTDAVYYYNATTAPNNIIMEAGDDWATINTRFTQKGSRLVESKIDARLAGEIWKDREGNYPEVIVRASTLQTAILLLSSTDPESAYIEPFKDELDELLEGLNKGTIVLPHQRSIDSSCGIIRTVTQNAASDLFPVELKGDYTGSGYELLKVFIDTSENGAIGTAKMSVSGKDGTQLKNQVLVDSDTITGDFQTLGAGTLEIRWSGDDVTTAVCTAADEYEIEIWGKSLGASTPGGIGSATLTRR